MTDDLPAADDSTATDDAADPQWRADPADGVEADRYARLSLADGAVIVYDRTETDAWIQSDVTCTVRASDDVGAPAPVWRDPDAAAGGE
ncbi:hypothetical protein ACFQRB_19825 [Halobaculum litoreum]|uniref:Uncharacterized protein n=1 Tax=Halobaculum litoreum TaxID=3031998 RepID=A0ABD5XSQ4_9EURY